MHGVFGYMCWLVIFKWMICWVPADQTHFLGADGTEIVYECSGKLQDTDAPPDIKQLLIGMFMSWGTYMPNTQVIYSGMNNLQMPLVTPQQTHTHAQHTRTYARTTQATKITRSHIFKISRAVPLHIHNPARTCGADHQHNAAAASQVIICLICPIIMLFPKPLILRAENKKVRAPSPTPGTSNPISLRHHCPCYMATD